MWTQVTKSAPQIFVPFDITRKTDKTWKVGELQKICKFGNQQVGSNLSTLSVFGEDSLDIRLKPEVSVVCRLVSYCGNNNYSTFIMNKLRRFKENKGIFSLTLKIDSALYTYR